MAQTKDDGLSSSKAPGADCNVKAKMLHTWPEVLGSRRQVDTYVGKLDASPSRIAIIKGKENHRRTPTAADSHLRFRSSMPSSLRFVFSPLFLKLASTFRLEYNTHYAARSYTFPPRYEEGSRGGLGARGLLLVRRLTKSPVRTWWRGYCSVKRRWDKGRKDPVREWAGGSLSLV